ncbi:MAG: serine protease [Idiomarinaceae bacterium]|nr:serine protease [Idiomarinaceae bacterium]|tara:strand:- start:2358 stop:3110 length:753 start_codon:yes stop_codon:yes gene_type:complete
MIGISEPSVKSLFIEMRFNDQPLATGTAFVVAGKSGPLLVTNRHNVTGRNPYTGEPLSSTAGVPNQIMVIHNRNGSLGKWVTHLEPILDAEDNPLWIEHPTLGENADFVALPLKALDDVEIIPYDVVNTGPKFNVGPADILSVVGFPFGLQAGGSMAIWATGFMASEPDIDFNNWPVFLRDCRSRQGQSGSAVIAHRAEGTAMMIDGKLGSFANPVYKFLGIYSGRINQESDLGVVWRASAIRELVDSIR